jgi:hypothetical protein
MREIVSPSLYFCLDSDREGNKPIPFLFNGIIFIILKT